MTVIYMYIAVPVIVHDALDFVCVHLLYALKLYMRANSVNAPCASGA